MNEKNHVAAIFKNHNARNTDNFLTWLNLISLLSEPLKCAKPEALAIAPQLSGVKTKDEVLAHNKMSLLWVDIDSGNYSISDIKAKLKSIEIGATLIYSTASSGTDNKRWRILIELEKPIDCRRWVDIQEALALLLHGDSSAVRVQQILYAPCTPPSSSHYQCDILTGARFSKTPAALSKIIFDLKAKRKIIHQKITSTIQSQRGLQDKNHSNQGEFNIQKINDTLDTNTLLETYGYKRIGRKWLSPNTSSGTAGVIAFKDGRWFSHHASDHAIGHKTEGGVCGDGFDLVTYYEYGGDYTKSLAKLCCSLDPEGQKQRQFEWVKKQGGVS